jgi:hypothetical protein
MLLPEPWVQLWPPPGEGSSPDGRLIRYNPDTDVLEINGVKWSGESLEKFMRNGEAVHLTVYRFNDEIICHGGPPAPLVWTNT